MSSTNAINIPSSLSTVRVSIIDTSLDAYLPTSHFFGPTIKGFENFRAIAYAFLVTHTDNNGKERKIVFDLGTPKDLENDFPPSVGEGVKAMFGRIKVDKYVSEILTEKNIPLESIESVVWSHTHLDHVGRPSLFPASVSLIVGPGAKEAYYPGYPANPDAPVLSREFEGRELIELDFGSTGLEIGGLQALDYFGDGSFYFLSAPGHAVGHINALARTTEGTFIYMSADSFHHGSVLRPHFGSKLPTDVNLPSLCCAGKDFHPLHPLNNLDRHPEYYQAAFQHGSKDENETPFYTISQTPDGKSLAVDIELARTTIRAVQKFDADENVFVVAAHDTSLYHVLEYLPKEANDWKGKGWKEEGKWLFLQDLKPALDIIKPSDNVE